jgi:hypothetical protein
MARKAKLAIVETPLKLDLGCGKKVEPGFIGVDSRAFGQDIVTDLTARWPWDDGTVEEARACHFIEHLTAAQRIHFVNELHRVLVPGGKCQMIVPNWSSCRAYGDLTHQWPPVSEMWFYYLKKEWRDENAPHNEGYTCDFEATWGYGMHPTIAARNQEYQQHALTFFKEAAQDIVATLIKRCPDDAR